MLLTAVHGSGLDSAGCACATKEVVDYSQSQTNVLVKSEVTDLHALHNTMSAVYTTYHSVYTGEASGSHTRRRCRCASLSWHSHQNVNWRRKESIYQEQNSQRRSNKADQRP